MKKYVLISVENGYDEVVGVCSSYKKAKEKYNTPWKYKIEEFIIDN